MKIIVVGASGTIGKKVVSALEAEHEVIKAGLNSGDHQVDIHSPESIEAFFKKVGPFDALISTTGIGHFGPLSSTSPDDFKKGLESKLGGQVNLVLIGQHYINPKVSFTLTSGTLSHDPVLLGASLSAVNGGINSFVIGAAVGLENGVRINAVSPSVVEDSPSYFFAFPGVVPVTMSRLVAAYVKCVLGAGTGRIYEAA